MIPAKVPASRPEQAREAEQVPTEIVAPGTSLVSKENIQNTSEANKDVQRVVTYPAWPTSQPGPQATPPPTEQHPHPRRSEQMIYANYDQERGMVDVLLPKLAEQEHRGKKYTLEATPDAIPAASVQDNVTETID